MSENKVFSVVVYFDIKTVEMLCYIFCKTIYFEKYNFSELNIKICQLYYSNNLT